MVEARLLREDLNGPLPNLEMALKRIGINEPVTDLSVEGLDRVVRAMATHVPYENLTVSIQKKLTSLTVNDLFEKIVIYRRGGFCFELNGFFYLLLRDLGFKVHSVSCYVLKDKEKLRDMGHRANIVEIDGRKYVCDVGFGGGYSAAFAVPIDGSEKGDFFVIKNEEGEYTLCCYVGKEEKSVNEGWRIDEQGNSRKYFRLIMFRDFRAYPEEFVLPNFAVCHMPDHPMICNVIANLRTEAGDIYTMYNNEFKMTTEEGKFSQVIEDEEERMEILREFYGMDTSCFE